VQCADIKVFRDLNEDFERDGDETFVGIFGINQHWGFDLPLNSIGNASAGCLWGARSRAIGSSWPRSSRIRATWPAGATAS
jgi:hypothetical protein